MLKALSIALTLALAAAPAAAQTQTLLPLRIATLKQSGLADLWLARQTGIFEKNGLAAELIEFRTGNEAISAQRGGQVDVIVAIPGSAMMAIETGFDLVLLSQHEAAKTTPPDMGSIQVRPDSGLESLKDLVGKTIAVSGFHSQWTVAVQTLLRKAGAEGGKTQIVEVPFPAMPQALRNKTIDAAAVIDPFGTQMRASGIGKVISWGYIDTIPGQPNGAFWARASFIEKNREAVTRFVKALHEAVDYMNADEARARKAVADYTGLDASIIAAMQIGRAHV